MPMTREEAMVAYRNLWIAWKQTNSATHRRQYEKGMDALQPQIAVGPWDPVWKEFAASLPGFLEFWNHPSQWFKERDKELKE